MNIKKTIAAALAAGAYMLAMPFPAFAARTVSGSYTLSGDEDWTADGVVTLDGATIDLAGHSLKVAAMNGTGTIVSTMADLTSPSGSVSSSGGFNENYPAGNLFDNDSSTLAVRTATSGDALAVCYDFGGATLVNRYRLYAAKLSTVSAPGFPATWTVEGSNDNESWTELDARDGETLTNETWAEYDFENSTAFRYYRMVVTKGSRYNSSTSKDPRIDFGGELEFGYSATGTLSVDLAGLAESDFSQIEVSDEVVLETSGASLALTQDIDMRGFMVSADIDLNGHTLTVDSLSGGGTVTDSSAPVYKTPAATTLSANLKGNSGYLFDGDTTTVVYNGSTSADPVYVVFDFGDGTKIDHYDIYAYTSARYPGFPEEWTFAGSDDGSEWTVLDSRAGVTMANDKRYGYDFANAKEFRYYRLHVTKGSRWNSSTEQNPRIDVAGEMTLGCRKPGSLVVDVPQGKTIGNSDVTLSGNLRLVKDGAGTLVASKADQTYTGGTEVSEGTLEQGTAGAGLFGPDGAEIKVAADGVFDTAGRKTGGSVGKYLFKLAGGAIASSTAATTGANYESVRDVVLSADSSFDSSASLYVGSSAYPGTIDIGGNTLSATIGNGQYLRLDSGVMTNGTFSVAGTGSGTLIVRGANGVDARTVDVKLNCPLLLANNSSFSVRGYESLWTGDNGNQNGTLYVYGAFTPTTDYWYGCTLADGATLDLSTRTGALNAVSSAAGNQTALAFEENAVVNVVLGDKRFAGGKILSWTSETKPTNIDTVKFVRADADRPYALTLKSDGLYAQAGLIISFH